MINKETIKDCVVVMVFAAVMLTLGFIAGRCYTPKQEPIINMVTDTITDWQHDTVFRTDTKVVKLPIHDTTTLTDSLWLTDSVLVEVPMMCYRYDTTLTDTNSTTHLTATLSGYEVKIDTLTVNTTIQHVTTKETMQWYRRFRPSVGVGVGTNLKGEATAGVYFGVGYLF